MASWFLRDFMLSSTISIVKITICVNICRAESCSVIRDGLQNDCNLKPSRKLPDLKLMVKGNTLTEMGAAMCT